jgi:hypothetical protein
VLNRAGVRTRRLQLEVCVAGGGAMAGVALAKGLKMVLPQSASFNTYAGLTLSVDTVTGFPRTRSCSSLSATGPGKGAPEPGVLRSDGEGHACSYGGPCARMWLRRRGALPELL